MKLKTKINIDILDFIKNGKFDYIKLGQTKEWILNNFPDPDILDFKYNIWTYGNIEFHFEKNELYSIFSDYLLNFDGGNSLDLNKWILTDCSILNLAYVLSKLNEQGIDYCKSSNNFGVILTTKSGVELGFCQDLEESELNPNQLLMKYLGLSNKSFIFKNNQLQND